MSGLRDKIAIVTGCGKGIGRAIGLALAREGAVVVATDIDEKAGEATASELRTSNPRSTFHCLDIADHTAVNLLVDTVAREFGAIDILVNNAGVTKQTAFFDVTPQEIDWINGVNIRGTFSMMQAAARAMRANNSGRIVNISSIAGKGYRNTSNIAYAASKAAIVAMTRVAAAQLGPYGIGVNAVCPGITETEMMASWLDRRAAERGRPRQEVATALLAGSALRRMNSPTDIADAVLFLASDASHNITGQSLNIDSGMVWD